MFTFEFIQSSAQDIEQNEELSRLYFIAILAAGTVSPLFGILNDWLGARVNNLISRSLPAFAAASTLWIEPFDTKYRLGYLIFAFISMVWSEISISYACSHIFGVRCGL